MKHYFQNIRTPIGNCKRAFTLIELLVVVVVIAILIALTYPMLMKARSRADSVKCMSNLKNLGTGLNLYVSENNYYPGAIPSPGTFWIQIAEQYATSKEIQNLYNLSAIVRCPARAPNTGTFGVGYGYNFAGFGFTATSVGAADLPMEQLPPVFWHVSPSRIQHPSKVIVLGDGLDVPPPGTYTELFLYLNYFDGAPKRHGGGGNYLFADGHIEWLTSKTLQQLFSDGKPEPLYPF